MYVLREIIGVATAVILALLILAAIAASTLRALGAL